MAELTAEKEIVLEKYKKADSKGKKLLESIFPKKVFIGNITDRIKTFEEAYPVFKKMKYTDELYLILQKRKLTELTSIDMLMIIAEVLREGWEADYSNGNQQKWTPYFKYNNQTAGFGFSTSLYNNWHTSTTVGSRFAFPNQKLSDYFGTQFISLHNKYLIKIFKPKNV